MFASGPRIECFHLSNEVIFLYAKGVAIEAQ
jgi:hypothetical protein